MQDEWDDQYQNDFSSNKKLDQRLILKFQNY